jgi:molybdopterin-guanine dinucleotide biosynthesis protein A
MKHTKHTALAKPALGNFGRNEFAIIGTPCGNIQKLAQALESHLCNTLKTAYLDADHASDKVENATQPIGIQYIDKIKYHRLDFQANWTSFQFRSFFHDRDLILINGNHFEGANQIVVLDPKKGESLKKKLNRLTNVKLFLKLPDGNGYPSDSDDLNSNGIPAFLRNHIPNWQDIPVFNLDDTDSITLFLKHQVQKPVLNGLVLVGGKSQRMGRDKSNIDYHGKPQREYVCELLQNVGVTPYLSCRNEQVEDLSKLGYGLVPDTFTELGPLGAILSAFRARPNDAWLVIACDLPFLNEAILNELIQNRRVTANATAFLNPTSEFPEPLISIWEPKSYQSALSFFGQGISCPRKVLINSDTHLITASNPKALMNVNTPDELATYQSLK